MYEERQHKDKISWVIPTRDKFACKGILQLVRIGDFGGVVQKNPKGVTGNGKSGETETLSLIEIIKKWDVPQPYHAQTDKALRGFIEKWNASTIQEDRTNKLADTINYMKSKNRYFSHELPKSYLDFAIAQGGLLSGYRVTKALGLGSARHDGGKPQHDFVFTRQLPNNKSKLALDKGQVGASTDAMVVLSPTIFEDPEQMAFFKTFDGAHNTPNILPTKALKLKQILEGSNAVATSKDDCVFANNEQGIRGEIALKHIEAIVIKSSADNTEIDKNSFIEHLKKTYVTSLLPPKDVRTRIKRIKDDNQKVEAYKEWIAMVGNRSLYDVLKEGLNADLKSGMTERNPEDIVFALDNKTKRHEVVHAIKK